MKNLTTYEKKVLSKNACNDCQYVTVTEIMLTKKTYFWFNSFFVRIHLYFFLFFCGRKAVVSNSCLPVIIENKVGFKKNLKFINVKTSSTHSAEYKIHSYHYSIT